ncbi:pyruvate synthase subunit beta, partial [Candidatus Bipolaricaulota bacterium]|nr:pyruvate synthase subunit beta [Candidatus Bipolaricaulota bacterium]
MKIDEVTETDYMDSGAACPGCAGELALRLVLKELGEKTVLTTTPSCVGATCSVNISRINTAFPATAATSVGMSAGLKALGKTDVTVMAIAGDGGTADIGLQGLSGAAERGDDILYVCYDNEAYMNTGIQRSSA